jgi:molecular chaperone DnaK (HSP70)
MTMNNHELGNFHLDGIPPMKAGVAKIKVTFDIDANGILNVSACDEENESNTKAITISNQRGRLSTEDLERMYAEAAKFAGDDEAMAKKIEARMELEKYCYQLKETLDDPNMKQAMTKDEKFLCSEYYKDGLQWIADN